MLGTRSSIWTFVGVGCGDKDARVGTALDQRGSIGLEILFKEDCILLVDHAIGAHEQPRNGPPSALARADHDALALEIA